jgi:hypothetical protein
MPLIDVRDSYSHPWSFGSRVIIRYLEDVVGLRRLPVMNLHSWLLEKAACLGPDGGLSRDAVKIWVENNKDLVVSWLDQHSNETNKFHSFSKTPKHVAEDLNLL